jgi:ClpX C4-type zinc finger
MKAVDLAALLAEVCRRADEAPLDQIEAALAISDELQAGADELVGHVVTQARQAGCSWTEIGARLGVSKQAARQRFTRQPSGPSELTEQLECCISPSRRRRRGKGRDHHCSFCGKAADSGVEMVAGPAVRICAECVGLAGEILAERPAGR